MKEAFSRLESGVRAACSMAATWELREGGMGAAREQREGGVRAGCCSVGRRWSCVEAVSGQRDDGVRVVRGLHLR